MRTRSNHADGLDLLASKKLVYKIFGLSREEVPKGVREVVRKSDHQMDQKHADQAIAKGDKRSAMVGRVRPDRVDTGIAVYQRISWLLIGSVRSLLALRGYVLTDIHFFSKGGAGCVLVITLEREGIPLRLPQETVEQLRKIARENIFEMSVWDNSNIGNPSTINFHQRSSKRSADQKIVIRDGFLKVVDLDGSDPWEIERTEDARVSRELLEALESFEK